MKFIGRTREFELLKALRARKRAALVVIKGRRRIGKSRLAAEFSAGERFINITGMPPEVGTTAQDQRNIFSHQMEAVFKSPTLKFQDWIAAFSHLSACLTDEPTVILFDEISWMGSLDPTFIPKLKVWWDQDLQHRQNVILIFCGSVSTWIEANIIKSTSFFGRISQIIELSPLSIQESNTFLTQLGFKGSVIDKFKLLSVLGGIPWYLEQVSSNETADQNIHRLCFENKGLLTLEFDRIFHDLFSHKGEIYRNIMISLNEGMKNLEEIRQTIDYPKSGTLSSLMGHLITAGFVTQFPQWSIKTGKVRRQSLYRISDPYMRFYLKYIAPNLDKIEKKHILDMGNLPGYQTMMGFQVESLLLQNRHDILRTIGINAIDIVYDNPYSQRASARQKECQIDYLVQTRTNNLYVCEFKFRLRELGKEIITEVSEKIDSVNRPKGYAVVPILFHVGGVSEAVEESDFFYRIVDIGDLLEPI